MKTKRLTMQLSKLLAIAIISLCCLLLSACQSTSLREISSDKDNFAKQGQIDKSKQDSSSFPAPQVSQLRMYVFTGFEHKDELSEIRDGYYVDFSVTEATSKQQGASNSN